METAQGHRDKMNGYYEMKAKLDMALATAEDDPEGSKEQITAAQGAPLLG